MAYTTLVVGGLLFSVYSLIQIFTIYFYDPFFILYFAILIFGIVVTGWIIYYMGTFVLIVYPDWWSQWQIDTDGSD